jgi:transcriptional regulator with XRE-family HTH domain
VDALGGVIGSNIKTLRKARGLSQAELGFLIQSDATAVSRYERGINTPSIESLYKLSKALCVPMYELLPILHDPARERLRTLKMEVSEQLEKIDTLEQMEAISNFVAKIADEDDDE